MTAVMDMLTLPLAGLRPEIVLKLAAAAKRCVTRPQAAMAAVGAAPQQST